MNYDDLSVHERIKHASEYAVILKNNPANTPGNIIAELAETFSLTKEQASEAYILSEEKFPEEHKKAARSKLRHHAAAIFHLLSVLVFFTSECGSNGAYVFPDSLGLILIRYLDCYQFNTTSFPAFSSELSSTHQTFHSKNSPISGNHMGVPAIPV